MQYLCALFARSSTLSGEKEEWCIRRMALCLEQGKGVLSSGQDLTYIGLRPGIQAPFGQRRRDSCGGLIHTLLDQNSANMKGRQGTKGDLLTA